MTQSLGIKTINLNLIAAILQLTAFILWSGGNNLVRYLYVKEHIKKEEKE